MTKPTLYHATSAAKDENGNYTKFPTELTPRDQETINGRHGKFVFAGSSLPMAVAYALKNDAKDHDVAQLKSCGYTIEGVPIAIIDDLNKLLKHPQGQVFQIPNEDFTEELYNDKPSGEWVSEQKIKELNLVKVVTPKSAMKIGVQIFIHVEEERKINERKTSINPEYQTRLGEIEKTREKMDENLSSEEKRAEIQKAWFLILEKLVDDGLLLHLNKTMMINPIDLKTGLLEDMSFIKNTQKITSPSQTTKVKDFTHIANTQNTIE